MNTKKYTKNLIILIPILFFSGNIFAYIDPGSGSAITAAIIAFFSGIIFYLKKYYFIIKRSIKKIFRIN
jgi:Sec-independent protein secretion pathway component TatC